MKITNFISKILLGFAVVVSVSSCSKNEDVFEEIRASEIEESNTLKQKLKQEPKLEKVFTKSNGSGTSYTLFAKLSLAGGLPDELYINGYVLTDNGKYLDKKAGDGLYTVYRPIEKASFDQRIGTRTLLFGENNTLVATQGSEINAAGTEKPCRIRFVNVGEPCAGGTCPSDSILGGSTWKCICISDCESPF